MTNLNRVRINIRLRADMIGVARILECGLLPYVISMLPVFCFTHLGATMVIYDSSK